jgi:hypothetical protein
MTQSGVIAGGGMLKTLFIAVLLACPFAPFSRAQQGPYVSTTQSVASTPTKRGAYAKMSKMRWIP